MSKLLKNKLIASTLSFSRDLAIHTKITKNLFDLLKFVDKNILEDWIRNPTKKTLVVSKVKNVHEILNGMNCLTNFKEVQEYFETYNVHITKKLLMLLEKDFDNYIKEAKDVFYKELTSFNEKFVKLNKLAKDKEIESSIWCLNIGAFYISGITNELKKFNAPIIIIPVVIEKNKHDLIEIKKINSLYKTNTKLNFLLKQYYNLEIEDFETDNFEDFNIYFEKLNKYLIPNISNPFNNSFNEFENQPKEDKKYTDPLEINNFVTLSLFDSDGGKILKDVNEIFEVTDDPFKMGNVIKDDKYINEIINLDDLIAINNKLNIYQKYAIKAALNDNTLIYGPPGTGKSETIASLIANILYLDKNVLMVSEKKAALDVVINRLGNLKYLALNIYDNQNKANFYNKIKHLLEVLNNSDINRQFNYHQQIRKNDNCLLNYLKQTYEIENDLLNLQLPRIETYLKDCGNFIKTIVDLNKIKSFLDLVPSPDLNTQIVLNIVEKSKEFIKLLDQNKNFKELIFQNHHLKFKKIDFDKFKSIYSIAKEKYKAFILNNYLNTGIIKKGNLFSHKIKNNWIIFDETVLILMENLYQSTTEISKYVIEKIQKMLSEFEHIEINHLNDYFNLLKVNRVVGKYDFRYSTEINKKIKLYEQDSNRNAKTNCDQILKWYINKLRNIINLYLNNKFDPDLSKQIKNIFKISTRKIFPSVANFIKTNYRALKILFPIWIMSPNEVSINLPNQENIFDYGIFDEASQMFVENSIPSIFRCQNVCVAGDDKQLKPTNFFSTKLSYSDDEFEDEDFVANSLLDKAKESLWHEFNLKNHYRSKNANLIKFSNEFIYNNELETATINGNFEDWIEVYNVNGIWDDKRNSIEIDDILDYLEKKYTNQDYLNSVSYLLVTFNQSQKDELENRFASQLAIKYEYLRFAYENQLLKFRNIENVQGDEANFVIFSCTYAKNKENKFIQNFGPLMQDNGPNRLNVALTRAKEKMIVFKSFYGHEITNLTNNPNTEIFKQFILSIDNIKTENEIQDLTQNWINQPLEFDSNFEQNVYYKLVEYIDKNRYTILTQFKVGSKRIDQVIFDIKQKKVILGIEVDGIKYHNGYKKVLEDIDRQYFLENRGYKIFRIKEYDWLSNEHEVINQILKTLQYC